MAPAFLDAMVSGASGKAEVALWEGVLRDSFAALSPYPFLDPDKAEGAWKRCERARGHSAGAAGQPQTVLPLLPARAMQPLCCASPCAPPAIIHLLTCPPPAGWTW